MRVRAPQASAVSRMRSIGAAGPRRKMNVRGAGIVSVLLAVLMTTSVVSVGAATSAGATATKASRSALYALLPQKIKAAGKIVDYVEPTYPPMEMVGKNGKGLTGIDVELARAVAKTIGIKLDIVTVETFAGLFPAITSGRADMVWSGVFDSVTRRKYDVFVDYFSTGTQLYIPTASKSTYKNVSQLCGKTIAGETATLFQGNLTHAFKSICKNGQGLTFVNSPGIAQQNLLLTEGRAQASVAGPEIIDRMKVTTPGKYVALGPIFNPTYYGVVLHNSAFGKQLGKVVQKALNQLIKNGTYAKILKHYGVASRAVKQATFTKGTVQY